MSEVQEVSPRGILSERNLVIFETVYNECIAKHVKIAFAGISGNERFNKCSLW